MSEHGKPFGMMGPRGWKYIGLHDSADDCWKVALGWPSESEISAAKSKGYFVTEIHCTYSPYQRGAA